MPINYEKQTYVNGSGATPLSAARLNHNENGTKAAADAVDALGVTVDGITQELDGRLSEAGLSTTFAGRVVDPDDVGFDVVLLAGQSNMMGQAEGYDTARIDLTDPRIFQYGNGGAYANMISLAVDPLAHHEIRGMGPGLTFARWYLNTVPSNRRVLLVPVAHGGTAFAGGTLTWDPSAPNDANNLYENAIRQTQAALAAGGKASRLVAILWLQGESDAINSTPPATYRTKLDALIDGFRTRLSAPDVPFVLGQMLPETIAANPTYAAINAVHLDTPKRKLRTAYSYGAVGMNNGDGLHYNAPGQRVNGRRFFDALPLARANVLGTPPLPVEGVAITQSGTTLTATWTRPACRFTAFVVEYRQGNGAWTPITRAYPMDASEKVAGLTLGGSYEVRVTTQNEAGAAAPVSATITLATVPGQVSGLATGTPAGTSMPLSWSALAGATSYVVEYKRATDATWSTFANQPMATSVTVTGLNPDTEYDFRVSGANAAGTGNASVKATAVTQSLPLLLADVPVAAIGAYSLRRLRSSYVGNAIRVRRGSDNAEQDVGFTGNSLNTSALLAFIGSGNGYVTTWYDQSGGGRNFTQTTFANQPRIVNAGVVETLNGLPTVFFDGATGFLSLAEAFAYAAGAATVMAVTQGPTQAAGGTRVFAEVDGGVASGSAYSILGTSSSSVFVQIRNTAPANVLATGSAAGTPFNDVAHVLATVDTGSNVKTFVDATSGIDSNYTRGTMNLTRAGIGAAPNTTPAGFFAGRISEIVVWGSALSSANRVAGAANDKAYYGTP